MLRPFPRKSLAALIAVRALPGAPRYDGDDRAIVREALSDLAQYLEAGVDAIVLENSYDLPDIKPPLPAKGFQKSQPALDSFQNAPKTGGISRIMTRKLSPSFRKAASSCSSE